MAALEAKVAGSSFYAAMKRMPPHERAAMFAIYAFCRAVDDIADDGQGARADRARQLDAWRADIDALYAGQDAGQAAFLDAEAVRDFGLRKRRTSWRSSTAWPWTWRATSWPPTRPSSTSIATGWPALWGGCRSRCSAWTTRTGNLALGAPSGPGACS